MGKSGESLWKSRGSQLLSLKVTTCPSSVVILDPVHVGTDRILAVSGGKYEYVFSFFSYMSIGTTLMLILSIKYGGSSDKYEHILIFQMSEDFIVFIPQVQDNGIHAYFNYWNFVVLLCVFL